LHHFSCLVLILVKPTGFWLSIWWPSQTRSITVECKVLCTGHHCQLSVVSVICCRPTDWQFNDNTVGNWQGCCLWPRSWVVLKDQIVVLVVASALSLNYLLTSVLNGAPPGRQLPSCHRCSWLTTTFYSEPNMRCDADRTYSTFGDRAFAAVGPGLWNSLPSHLKEADLS